MKKFNEYFKSLTPEQKESLARKAETSVQYLYQVSLGNRNAGWKTIQKLTAADRKIKFAMFQDDQ